MGRLEKFLEQKARCKDTFDETGFLKYMYCNEGKKGKRYDSFHESEEEGAEEAEKRASDEILKSPAARRLSDAKGKEDEISQLDKLSMLNIGARFELLNAKRMMLDLDLGLVILNGWHLK